MVQNQKNIRILHIMSGYGGGIASFIQNKALEMSQYNVTFDVVTYDECSPAFTAAIENTGGHIYQLQNPKVKGWRVFKESFETPLQDNNYDVIHCHIDGYRALPYKYIIKKQGINAFYIHAHLVKEIDNQTWKVKTQHHVDQLINNRLSSGTVGCGKLAIKSSYGENTDSNQMMVIPNSIDDNQFSQANQIHEQLKEKGRKQYQITDDTLLIGHIGRLKPVKNHQKTIEIGEYIQANNLDAKILIIGSGELEATLKQEVTDKKLEEVVIFTGRVSPISEFFPALDVLLLPSLTEGLPTTVVESQAAGVAVVMSDVITDEVDLGMGMVQTLPLSAVGSLWYEKLEEAAKNPIPQAAERMATINDKKFTNKASAELYYRYFSGEIKAYQIEK